jgi:Rrf2 family protein
MLDLALHQNEGPVPLEVLASEQHIPERYLAKIIQDLRRGGIIRSVRGAHGGYVLVKPPAEVTLLDIWEALEGPVLPVECLNDPASCEMLDQCVTREVWARVGETLAEVLASETLADLVKKLKKKTATRSSTT